MDSDDPSTPLLRQPDPGYGQRVVRKLCGLESWKRRLPITIWLPKYNLEYLLSDAIAGITVGLTSIPQGIAYAMVAGLPPQVGLYSSIFPGLVYMFLGSCKDVTVGPTAILAALLAKYVAKSDDFAYLAAFLSGCIILLLGVLQLGVIIDFISKPVISGFTTAAALQIGAAQLKTLFMIAGSSGQTFIDAIVNFFTNIKTVQLWDTVLGVTCIITLVLLKKVKLTITQSSQPWETGLSKALQYVVRARNALVVFVATILAFLLYLHGYAPFELTGTIHGGLPHFRPPPFSTVVNNRTLDFEQMLGVFGPEFFVMPLVAILESIAIAKAFAGNTPVDSTQEMLAIGCCNIVASFAQCMSVTGSFTRTALNHACGVATPAGSFFKASIVILAVTFLAKAFYYIPRATLAAVIICAMASIIECDIVRKLWRNSKLELTVYAITVLVGCCAGLEYGIAAGVAADGLRVLANAARPHTAQLAYKVGNVDCVSITLFGKLSYASAEYMAHKVRALSSHAAVVVLDGRHVRAMDIGVAENLVTVIEELEKDCRFLLWNFPEQCCQLLEDLQPRFREKFVTGPSIDQHVLALELDRREIRVNNSF